jgi:hypothetical protein
VAPYTKLSVGFLLTHSVDVLRSFAHADVEFEKAMNG